MLLQNTESSHVQQSLLVQLLCG